MLYNVTCKTTGATGKVDAGSLSPEALREKQAEHQNGGGGSYGYHCDIGHHMELSGGVLTCLEIDFDTKVEDVTKPTVESLKARFSHVMATDELGPNGFTIESFSYGMAMADFKGQSVVLDYTSIDGKRYYCYGSK